MEFYLYKGKITGHEDFNPREEWLGNHVLLENCMWFAHGTLPFFEEHMESLNHKFALLGRSYRTGATEKSELLRLSLRLINKNKAYMGGWLRLVVMAAEEEWPYWASVIRYPSREIPFAEAGKLASFSGYTRYSEGGPALTSLGLPAILAGERLRISGTRYGEVIFCNEKGAVTDALEGNIYCLAGQQLFTPSLNTGCTRDNFRELTLNAAQVAGFETIESEDLKPADLQKMDEIFTVSEKNGFSWILGIGIKRFVRKKTEKIRDIAEQLLWENRKTAFRKD